MNVQKIVKRKQALKLNGCAIVKMFRWRGRDGNYYDPVNMETRHLFYTIRMIWNHNMPLKLRPYKKYNFNETYTDDYMKQALRAMVPELAKRKDIENKFRSELKVMTRWLSTVQIEERKKANKEAKNNAVLMVFK